MATVPNLSFISVVCILLLTGLASESWTFSIESGLIREKRDTHDHDHDHDHGDEAHFEEIGNYLLDAETEIFRRSNDFATNPNQNITADQLSLLISTVFNRVDCENRVDNCSKCQDDFVTDVFAALNVDMAYGLNEDNFLHASPILLYGVYQLEAVCQARPGGSNLTEDVVLTALMSAAEDGSNSTMSEEDLDVILDAIQNSYTDETDAKCFDVESVFTETVADHEAGADDEETRSASEMMVGGLLQGYCIGVPTQPEPAAFTDAVFDGYATDGVISETMFEDMLTSLGIGGDHSHDHEHDHRRRRSVAMETIEFREKRATETVEHDHDHPEPEVANVTQTCFSGEQLLDIYRIDHEAGITPAEFNELCPSLVQQILSGICGAATSEPSTITTAQTWGFGTLSVFIISLFSVLGAIFIPCMSQTVYERTIQTMIALAVATLTADATLHLIPQAVGLHAHGVNEVAHDPSSPEMAYIWKLLVVEGAIYIFFVFELMSGMTSWGSHSHTHTEPFEMKPSHERPSSGSQSNGVSHSESKKELTMYEGEKAEVETSEACCTGCGSIPFMIILGDSLHNFGDGLAIGAAFTVSVGVGLSTSIAVLCHELPHELGDLAVLLNQGMKLSTAVLLNLMSACTAFIGLWVGIPLAQTDSAREWIFAAVAGMFLYVGLVSMMPQLHSYKGKTSKAVMALFQNIGFLIGIGILLVIALYEDAISISI